ncbi:MAG: ABC transporter ATP-binding protein [Bacteroidales bacterium]|nr:ABC transporter ATP-binding protein [Bacteroidales bacterium]
MNTEKTNTDSDKILEINNLSISFKNQKDWTEVLHHISLSVNRGEILGLVGESGSGKSVTSLAVMNLLDKKISRQTDGEIIFNGKNKAMIFQEPMTALNPIKKCGGQVDEMIRTHEHLSARQAKEKTLELFSQVLLPDVKRAYSAYPFELSGGQRQRVMIAMALSCNPDLLIADEPTTALDVTVQKSVLELILNIQRQNGMSVLFISHDLGVVHGISDRIAVIYHGDIVETDTADNIFHNPKHIYTKSLIASRPPTDTKPERLLTIDDFINHKDTDVKIITKEQTEKHNRELYAQEPLMEVKNLEVDYALKRNIAGRVTKSFRAVGNVSFNVYKGETLGLVGESGCGKTTIGRALTHLIDISSGNITFEGKNLGLLSKKEQHALRKDIQIIFQDPYSSLNPRKTIGDCIEEPMIVYRMHTASKRKKEVLKLLNQVGLEENYAKRYPFELSGGQRQRVGIARALALQPKLIICDESVAALDVSVQAQVLNLLNDLKKDYGFTYIFISHDLSVVKYMSDRIIVMQKGSIAEQGLAEQIYTNPQTQYTKTLIDSIYK